MPVHFGQWGALVDGKGWNELCPYISGDGEHWWMGKGGMNYARTLSR